MTDPHCPHCAAPIPRAVRERIRELEYGITRYMLAVSRRNSTPYPEPSERMEIAKELDDAQEALFALVSGQHRGGK